MEHIVNMMQAACRWSLAWQRGATRLCRYTWQRWWAVALMAMAAMFAAPARAAGDPAQGPGGPVLVVTSSASTFGTYYAEILRAEGLNHFAVADIATVSASTLAAYDVVLLAKMPLTAAQVTTLSTWVQGGGNLVAMAPTPGLASLLGITPVNTTMANAYLKVNTGAAPGNGIVDQTMQFHGTADLHTLNGATALATLYSAASTPTSHPAVTMRSVGTGKAAAFAFDLATSIVYTRQGNPAWATQERDGFEPRRSNDKFYGPAASDAQADWVDLTKVSVPQADEQQRFLANLLLTLNQNKKPLPRFWYFPADKKAVIVMTGDDHGNGGTIGRFNQYKSLSAVGCSLLDWACIRGTSYIYPTTPITDAQAGQFTADGFEVGLHVSTSCQNYDAASLAGTYAPQVVDFQTRFPSAGALKTQRHHCIVWSDWTTGAVVQLANGMRMDTSYYYWPGSWVSNAPGVFTGSAMPMRFAATSGGLIDVYMAATQMTDESGQVYPFTVNTLLDRALGAEGYYGAYVVNAHTDLATINESDTVVASAQARGVSVISAKQLLTWVDGRNDSSFSAMSFSGNALTFTINKDPAAHALRAMVPRRFGASVLTGITRAGVAVTTTVQTIKGVEYVFIDGSSGTYVASYGTDTTAPQVTSTSPVAAATAVAVGSTVTATFNEAVDPATLTAATVTLRDASNNLVPASISYDAANRRVVLTPGAPLAGLALHTAVLRGGGTDPRIKDAAGNALAADVVWSFTTAAATPGPTCPCSAWGAATLPGTPDAGDPGAVELGVKFRTSVAGSVTGVRFYKGVGNTGTHVGNLWSATGNLLATATFTAETPTGWQQVNFSTPVAIAANTVYMVSYHAPNGHYAFDAAYFANAATINGPVELLRDGVNGGNGVYQYSGTSVYPTQTFNAANYWVDVVFTQAAVVGDTTPPTVTARGPVAGATGVASGSSVSATFSEALNAATVSTSTMELRNAANTLVTGTVTFDSSTRTAIFTPSSPLAAGVTYAVTLRGGTTDPRIKDVAGNALAANDSWSFTTAQASGGCAAPANAIVAENCLPGTPASTWDIVGVGDTTLQGYATDISVNRGATINFKVNTNATAYRLDIYRMGYYGGQGARLVTTVNPSAALPQTQPSCLTEIATGLIDCGNWGVSASWAVPAAAASGIYFAKLVRPDTGGASHIVFIVRNDASTSKLVFQTADTTWQAYNSWGGNSLYTGAPAGRAYKVSYNRPFNTRIVDGGQDWVFNAEYPMVRWLEANGYDVSYTSGVDVDRRGNLLTNHKAYLSVGHDEYWSAAQRANVEAARAAGVNLAFFSGNEIFWKTRWEPSIDGSGTAHRTLVSYKETIASAKIDPNAAWTGTWRDPRFSPPADGGKPENALSGTIFAVNGGTTSIRVPEVDGKLRFWRNTSVATQAVGGTAVMPDGTLGYEWDIDSDNGFRPPGLMRLSNTVATGVDVLQDFGSTYGLGSATHALTLYKHASGARVFGAGTIQWSWGLDAVHDRAGTPSDVRMQQATVNLLADMDAQPASLQAGLVLATASTDTAAPTSIITAPGTGATVSLGTPITVGGTASDAGGGVVGGVEVSVDGGTTWQRASGRGTWSYTWTPTTAGSVTLRSRAVDDSGNLETPAPGRVVTVQSRVCPCSFWSNATLPGTTTTADAAAVNVGVSFTVAQNGSITGLRFYKGVGNTGTHVGTLWSSSGTALASVTFTGETASGWQQANFATPVAVVANTVYVASYHAPNGGYASDNGYFSGSAFDNAPLRAPQDGVGAANGVYAYGASPAFPTSSYQGSNYWVDVVFSTAPPPPDTTPPTVSALSPASGATGISRTANVLVTFSEAMDAATINSNTVQLRTAGGALVSSVVTFNAGTRVATLNPAPTLAGVSTYTVTVRGGATDPRVKDVAGNAMAANRVWSFTTRP
jgi:Domain of unknown function (DUF4082)/Bacterial Ig-like domain/Bacterial Ig domain